MNEEQVKCNGCGCEIGSDKPLNEYTREELSNLLNALGSVLDQVLAVNCRNQKVAYWLCIGQDDYRGTTTNIKLDNLPTALRQIADSIEAGQKEW